MVISKEENVCFRFLTGMIELVRKADIGMYKCNSYSIHSISMAYS